jgi:acetoin utilization deacetylase AcuC-like enzyme
MVDALLGGEAAVGVSALRPPGHHAEPDRAMGFCYFDNVAVAARHAVLAHGVERVLILDWDVHHGNGTAAAFAGDPSVLVVSIHQWPLYPGTGDAESVGTGPGAGYTINLPVPPGTGDAVFLSLVEHVACPLVAAWRPQLVLVSAGFDAHAADPLADCRCTAGGYAAMTAALRRASDAVGAPLGLVLEGGYDLDALTASVAALLPELLAAAPTAGGAGARAVAEGAEPLPIALAALARLEPYWPRLNDYLGAT